MQQSSRLIPRAHKYTCHSLMGSSWACCCEAVRVKLKKQWRPRKLEMPRLWVVHWGKLETVSGRNHTRERALVFCEQPDPRARVCKPMLFRESHHMLCVLRMELQGSAFALLGLILQSCYTCSVLPILLNTGNADAYSVPLYITGHLESQMRCWTFIDC